MGEAKPLIEEIEGREQDDRAALRSAWKRVQYDRGRRLPTDLHVREFVFYVFATDRSGRGVQLSFADVAKELECKERTARHVVERPAAEPVRPNRRSKRGCVMRWPRWPDARQSGLRFLGELQNGTRVELGGDPVGNPVPEKVGSMGGDRNSAREGMRKNDCP